METLVIKEELTADTVQAQIDAFEYFDSNLTCIRLPQLDEENKPVSKVEEITYEKEADLVTALIIAEKYNGLKFGSDKRKFISTYCDPMKAPRHQYLPKEALLIYAKIYKELFFLE